MSEGKRLPLPLSGGCPCGAIRYQVNAMPLMLHACHCTDCQRHCASAFSLRLPMPASAFQSQRGQAKAWHFTGAVGVASRFWFCDTCAGRPYGGRVNVRAGTLDDTSWLAPIAHDFRRSVQPWERIAGGARRFATPAERNRDPIPAKDMARALAARLSANDRRRP
jgi:hypothetical protein